MTPTKRFERKTQEVIGEAGDVNNNWGLLCEGVTLPQWGPGSVTKLAAQLEPRSFGDQKVLRWSDKESTFKSPFEVC